MLFAFLMIAECLIARSILEDWKSSGIKIPLGPFRQLKNLLPKPAPEVSPEHAILSLVSQNSNMGIKDISTTMGLTTWTTRKLMQNLISKGQVKRQVDINMRGRRAFCYTAAPSYDRQLKQYMKAASSGLLQLIKNN
ncbi:hypothetical protein KW786_01645 [Candidatus Parcubacteria bacterium]|nr:hypothetical protein [Candidatus Parcubacteria bacterium]